MLAPRLLEGNAKLIDTSDVKEVGQSCIWQGELCFERRKTMT